MSKILLDYACFLNQSGYSQAAQNYIAALTKSGKYDIKLTVMGGKLSRPAISDEKYEMFLRMKKKEFNKDRIMIYHCIPTLQKRARRLAKTIGFATYETFDPPNKWIDILNKNDAVIAPSNFNYRTFAHTALKKPIFHIPHCIDMDVYNRDVVPTKKFYRFTFLFLGTWKKRKGYEQLIEAWLKEFKNEDGVQLMIKTDKVVAAKRYVADIIKQFGISKGFAPILFENKVFNEKELPGFIKSFDCLILPTMGEGFNIPGLQCMALGVPVAITNFSGCKDYANEDTATLIDPEGYIMLGEMDGIPQFKNKKWAFITVHQIRETLRKIIDNKQDIKTKTDSAYNYVSEKFSYKAVSDAFGEMIGSLYND